MPAHRRLLALLPLLAAFASVVALPVAPASATSYTRCSQSDPDNGITRVRAKRHPCRSALRVAQHTFDVKCFLNGDRCEYGFRGRTWKCRARSEFTSFLCTSGKRRVRWRGPESSGASAAGYRACGQSSQYYGIFFLKTQGQSCPAALRIAKKTFRVKCFLNRSACSYAYLGRTWRCRITVTDATRVTCTSGARRVRWRGQS